MKNNGRVSFGCLLIAVILLVGGYHGYKLGFPYVSKSLFEEKLFEVAEYIFHQDRAESDPVVIQTAADYHIVITPENIKYKQTQDQIIIEVEYNVPVDTPLIKRTLEFKVKVERSFIR